MQPSWRSSVHAGGASRGPRRRLRARRCAGVGVGRVPALAASCSASIATATPPSALTATSLTAAVASAVTATAIAATIAAAVATAHTVAAQVDAAVRRAGLGV